MVDKTNKENLTYYDINKSGRVVQCVLGEETFGLADASDFAIVIQYNF